MSALSLRIVSHLNGAAMQLHQLARQVQSYSRSYIIVDIATRRIETLEDMLLVLVLDAASSVGHLNTEPSFLGKAAQINNDTSVLWSELKSVRQQIHHNLVEISLIHICPQLILGVVIEELYVLLRGRRREELIKVFHETNQFHPTVFELELSFLSFA